MTSSTRVSYIIQQIEAKLSDAIDLQKEAYEMRKEAINMNNKAESLVEQSKKIEMESLNVAIDELGDEQGRMAHSLVVSTLEHKIPEVSLLFDNFSNKENKFEIYGVEISERNKERAEEIINEAMDKSIIENPYGSDRGKNAWRRMLFENVRANENESPEVVNTSSHKDSETKKTDQKNLLENENKNGIRNISKPNISFLRDM